MSCQTSVGRDFPSVNSTVSISLLPTFEAQTSLVLTFRTQTLVQLISVGRISAKQIYLKPA
jgi:hypothetical protein